MAQPKNFKRTYKADDPEKVKKGFWGQKEKRDWDF